MQGALEARKKGEQQQHQSKKTVSGWPSHGQEDKEMQATLEARKNGQMGFKQS